MNMTDELERLSKLHKEGSLNDEEFTLAKSKLLSQPAEPTKQDNSLGEAANRNATSEILLALIGVIVLLILVFGVVLPHWPHRDGLIFEFHQPR